MPIARTSVRHVVSPRRVTSVGIIALKCGRGVHFHPRRFRFDRSESGSARQGVEGERTNRAASVVVVVMAAAAVGCGGEDLRAFVSGADESMLVARPPRATSSMSRPGRP